MNHQEKRLDILSKIPNRGYSDIWDTCCDHGKLGYKLIRHFPNSLIHFNDIVPHIIEKLKTKLYNVPSERYTLNTLDARNIKVSNDNTLIYICGIGGKMAIEIVNDLVFNNTNDFDLILCTHYHQHELRESLRDLNFKLIQSDLIVHQGQQYEMLYISRSRGVTIPPLSEELFNKDCEKSRAYFEKSMNHFKKNANFSEKSKEIYTFYRSLLSFE